ncbi:MAG: hypothetical protein AAB370_00140, partial [Verrucomicrobiota bacterium]
MFCCGVLAVLVTGCRLFQTAVEVPGQTVRAVTPGLQKKSLADPVEVQQQVLRFAEEFSTRIIISVDQLQRGSNALERAEVLRWKIALSAEIYAIATGPNAVANLLDMTVFVTVMRTVIEEHWQPKVFGTSARALVESCRNAETEIWQLASTVLKPPQQAELREAIQLWHRQNPDPENMLAARALGFALRVTAATQVDAPKPESVFSLLMVDPLAGMDPAVREITQTRLLAERALFVTQKTPNLLRWQMELLSVNTVAMPAVQQLVSNADQIASAVERFAAVAEKLPEQVRAERVEILKAFQAQEEEVASLLNSGTKMSDSLNTTLITFDALMKRFGVGETNSAPPAPNAEPFRILDYAQTAAQLEATARQLTELLVTLDRTIGSTNLAQLSAQVAPVVVQAQAGMREVVDYAFWKLMLL